MKKHLLAALALSCAVPAMAGDAYVGASLVGTKVDGAGGGFTIVDSDYKTGFKLYGGYQFTPTFGVEGGFADLGERDAYSWYEGSFANAKPQLFYGAATATLPVTAALSLHAKLGVAVSHTRLWTTGPGWTASATRDRTSALIGVGASYALNEKVSLVAEYEDFGRVASGSGPDVKGRQLSAGVRLKF
jgi:OOP family OmpA-OmpF porin